MNLHADINTFTEKISDARAPGSSPGLRHEPNGSSAFPGTPGLLINFQVPLLVLGISRLVI